MQKKIYYIIGILATIVFYATLYSIYIKKFLLEPNHYVFNLIGDGIKSYYSLLYFLKFDTGLHFTGMAYPYGDSYIFTDGQPLLAFTINIIKPFYPEIITYGVAFINLFVLISPIICVIVLQRILTYYKVQVFYSWAFAIGISLLSPQIERFLGHQSLSYTFFIPVVWLLLIKIHDKLKIRYGFLYTLFLLAMALLHPYYLAMGLVFYFLFLVVQLYFGTYSLKSNLLKILFLVFTGLLPLLIFQLYINTIILKADRVQIPWGFTYYRSAFASIFFNESSPLYFLQLRFLELGKNVFEGKAYLGFFGLPLFLGYFLYSVFNKFKNFKSLPKTQIHIFLYTGILAYIYATAFPFYMPPLDLALDYIPFITQFRGVGRFAWILFYTFNIFLVVYLFTQQRITGKLKQFIIILFLVVLYIEGIAHTKGVLKQIALNSDENIFIYQKPNLGYENPNDYQAILPVKIFAIGSEQMGLTHTDESIKNAFWISYHTGLPIMSFSMSRSSVSTALKTIQLASNKITYKSIAEDLIADKPILVLVSNTENLTDGETDLINRSKFILRTNMYSLYKLLPEKINATAIEFANTFNQKKNNIKSIHVPLYSQINEGQNKFSGEIKIFEGKANKFRFDDSIEFSVLTTKSLKHYGIVELNFVEKDNQGNIIQYYTSHPKENYHVSGKYIRLSHIFKASNADNKITITLKAKEFNFFSLLFTSKNSLYYHKNPYTHERYCNNYLLSN